MGHHSRQSRREFITRTVTAASALPLLGAFSGHASRWDSEALATFRARLKGRVILPEDANYDTARRIYWWNSKTERRPALIARCATADDVRHAVEFAHTQGLELAVRGGGHSPMGWGISNGLVVDVSGMTGVSVDPGARTARVEAGVLGGDVTRAAGRHGLAPILGQCPGVGAAGVTLGGGLGWLSGLHGAACDNLLAARIVTADGRLLSVDAESNPDLMWALRGAGANFGVVVDFACRLHRIDPVTAGEIHYPVRAARTVLRCFRDLMAEAPDAFQATINLTPGDRGVFVSLCHAGEQAKAERLLRVLRAAATPSRDTVRRQAFADLAGTPAAAPADVAFRYVATLYRQTVSDDVIDLAVDRLADAPPEMVLGLSHYEHGQVCRIAPDATAFPLRQSGGVHIRIGMDWNDAAAAKRLMAWADDTRGRMRASSGERTYVNYQSHVERGAAEAVFGNNLARLTALKNTYDPANTFRRNSNIQP